TWTEEILWPTQVVDLGKVDPRVVTQQSRYLYTSFHDPKRPHEPVRNPSGIPTAPANCYGRFDVATGKQESFFAGATHSLQEVTFVPRKGGGEGDGYLVGVATNY